MTTAAVTETDGSKQAGRIQGLDVLRGVALLLVLLRHAWPDVFAGAGIVGVTVFFALSGYLISTLLVRDITSLGGIQFKRFYIHRALRLFPALILMLAGFALIEGIWNIRGDRDEILRTVLVGLSYTMNIPGFHHGSDAVGHLWTLATEEQFYLIWPLVLMVGVRLRRPRLVIMLSIASVTLLCAVTLFIAPHVERVYSLPTSWFATMLIGSLAVFYRESMAGFMSASRVRVPAAVAASLILAALVFAPDLKKMAVTYIAAGPVIALCTVVLIFGASYRGDAVPAFLRPIQWLGVISYGAYLWNLPISSWLGDAPLSLSAGLLSILLTVSAAAMSWFLLERPVANVRRNLDRKVAQAEALRP